MHVKKRTFAIGRHLLERISEKELEDEVFNLVNHLNLGIDLVVDANEKIKISELNLSAGRKAALATAYEPAERYFTEGHRLLPEGSRDSHYQLCFELDVNLAYVKGMTLQFEESEKLLSAVINRTKNVLELTRAYEIRIGNFNRQNKLVPALDSAREILKKLGVSLPKKAGFLTDVGPALASAKLQEWRRGPKSILKAPVMTNPEKVAAMRIMQNIGSTAYQNSFNLFAVLIMRMIYISYKYGKLPGSAYALSLYGMAHSGVMQLMNQGKKYGLLALELVEKENYQETRCKSIMVYNTFLSHWKEPIEVTLERFPQGAIAGFEVGDFEFGSYCNFFKVLNSFYSTGDIGSLIKENLEHLKIAQNKGEKQALNVMLLNAQLLACLNNEEEDWKSYKGKYVNFEPFMQDLLDIDYRTGIGIGYVYRTLLHYLAGEYEEALVIAEKGRSIEQGIMCMSALPPLFMLHSLILLELCKDPEKRRKRYMLRVRLNQLQMRWWARNAPENHRHRYELVEAVKSALLNKKMKAMKLFEHVVTTTRDRGFLMDSAIATELTARFYTSIDMERVGRSYFREARYAYARWGCVPKVQSLEREFPGLRGKKVGIAPGKWKITPQKIILQLQPILHYPFPATPPAPLKEVPVPLT